MNFWLKQIFKSILILLAVSVILLIVTDKINFVLYAYKQVNYKSEIDSLFKAQPNTKLNVKYVYRSGDHGTIFFATIDSSYLTIIQAPNFQNILPFKINTEIINKTDHTDLKTYETIFHDNYPVIEAVLNPRSSEFLRILIQEPFEMPYKEKQGNHFYLSGDFGGITLSNSQVCYNIAIPDHHQELLILTYHNVLYILASKLNKNKLLEFINPSLL